MEALVCDRRASARYHLGIWQGVVMAFDLVAALPDAGSLRRRLQAAADGATELADRIPPRRRSGAARVVLRELYRRDEPVRSHEFDTGLHTGLCLALIIADDFEDARRIRKEFDRAEDIMAEICAGRLPPGESVARTVLRELERRRAIEMADETEQYGD